MAKNGLKCPDCGTLVRKPPAGLAGVVQCLECQTEIWYDPKLDEEKTALQAQPSPEPPPLWALPADDDRPGRSRSTRKRTTPPPKKQSGNGGLWIGLIAAGVLVMALGGGGVLLWSKWGQAEPSGPALTNGNPGPAAGGVGGAGVGQGEAAIPLETLQHLKRATIFIKVQRGLDGATGSGFVVNTVGDATYVVTNNHVVNLTATRPGPMRPFGPRPPFGPIGPIGPVGPMLPFGGPAAVQLVFHSGSPQEQTIAADVIHIDAANDLALLLCRGVQDAPKPVKIDQPPKLVETMPLFIFGFPFGEDLAVDRGNPAITVTKGSVSSIRMNAAGELSVVQIDGDLNPGNSGGPVTDSRGNLVGVAVAKVENTNIGKAIPAQEVKKLLPRTEKGPLAGGAPNPNDVAQAPPKAPAVIPPDPRPQPQLPPAPPPRVPLNDADLDRVLAELKDKNGFTKRGAIGRLAAAEPTDARRLEVVKALEDAIATGDHWTKPDAAKALTVWGPKECVPTLVKLLDDESHGVRWPVLRLLGDLKDERAAEPVARAFPRDFGVGAQALVAMGPVAAKASATLLKHESFHVRIRIVDVLRHIGTRDTIPALEEASKELALTRAAQEAIQAIQARGDRKVEADNVQGF